MSIKNQKGNKFNYDNISHIIYLLCFCVSVFLLMKSSDNEKSFIEEMPVKY